MIHDGSHNFTLRNTPQRTTASPLAHQACHSTTKGNAVYGEDDAPHRCRWSGTSGVELPYRR